MPVEYVALALAEAEGAVAAVVDVAVDDAVPSKVVEVSHSEVRDH